MSLYSVVVPVYNSEHTLEELYHRLEKVFRETLKEDFELILECADKPSVYEDEAAFNRDKSISMNFESVIPIGLFPAPGNESFVQSPHIILNGKIAITYENPIQFGFDESDVLYSFSCLGNEYDAVMYPDFSDGVRMKEGNIVSCVYRVQGWPKPE